MICRVASAACLCALALLPLPGRANDGWGGLSATGLTFAQTDRVAMLDEDLRISPDRISVDYVFRNLTDQDVTGEVIFPLPPISLAEMANSDMNLPADVSRDNLVDFVAEVDGQPVAVQVDRIAVIEPPYDPDRTESARYDAPGEDVTDRLRAAGLPLSVDLAVLEEKLSAMSMADKQRLWDAGLISSFGDGLGDTLYPNWSIVLRYHWTQTFPAGRDLRIHHAYENHPSGGVFGWEIPVPDYLQDTVRRYCVDKGTSKAILKAIHQTAADGSALDYGTSLNIDYVLRTANSWAGPIGHFKLTLDKGSPKNVISLCADGVKKTGPTTFVVEKTDFTPQRDLEILVVQPGEME